VQARAEVIAAEIFLFEVKLRNECAPSTIVSIPFARAISQIAFTGVIWPVMFT
jgi:hypothetical protein